MVNSKYELECYSYFKSHFTSTKETNIKSDDFDSIKQKFHKKWRKYVLSLQEALYSSRDDVVSLDISVNIEPWNSKDELFSIESKWSDPNIDNKQKEKIVYKIFGIDKKQYKILDKLVKSIDVDNKYMIDNDLAEYYLWV